MPTFYEKNSKHFEKVIAKYREEIVDPYASEGALLLEPRKSVFESFDKDLFKYSLRDYQTEALYLLDYLWSIKGDASKSLVQELSAKLRKVKGDKSPMFCGYEMATGSGKTILMAACIYLLAQRGVKNFLILTPRGNLALYKQIIDNFSKQNLSSFWSKSCKFDFNLITGENYTNASTSLYNSQADTNIFIFNTDKFNSKLTKKEGADESSIGQYKTDLSWESSPWTDKEGNNISIREYLSQNELVIISDEAHRAQSTKFLEITSYFDPSIVLEFTATAKEGGGQKVVYKYNIRNFLEDGYGKNVRAVGIQSEGRDKDINPQGKIQTLDKEKLVTQVLIHLVKTQALDNENDINIRPLSLIRVGTAETKNEGTRTDIAQKIVMPYLLNELADDKKTLHTVLTSADREGWEITRLIKEYVTNKYGYDLQKETEYASLRSDIRQLLEVDEIKGKYPVLLYLGESRSDKKTIQQFQNIKNPKSSVQFVVYLQALDEGIDLSNIYTICVINDRRNGSLTSVKQIIGRGVRLPRLIRIHDSSDNLWQKETEKLHIICDRGNDFQNEIDKIQNEFGLNSKYFASEESVQKVVNKVDSDKIKDKKLPKIQLKLQKKESVSLLELISDTEGLCDVYMFGKGTVCNKERAGYTPNCYTNENNGKTYLKYVPKTMFTDVDIFKDDTEFQKLVQQSGGNNYTLVLDKKDVKSLQARIISAIESFAGSRSATQAIESYTHYINSLKLQVSVVNEGDILKIKKFFESAFTHFLKQFITREYFDLQMLTINDEFGTWFLNSIFTSEEIEVPPDQLEEEWKKRRDNESEIRELIKKDYQFRNFEDSVYDYDNFDSYPEFKITDYFVRKAGLGTFKDTFWIRNKRKLWFGYGKHRFYPDLIVYYQNMLYVIEVKGERYDSPVKRKILYTLSKSDIGCKGLTITDKQISQDIIKGDLSFIDIINLIEKAEKKEVQEIEEFEPEEAEETNTII